MARFKHFLLFIAIAICSTVQMTRAQSNVAMDEMTADQLSEDLTYCRTFSHGRESWVISGYAPAQVRLPDELNFDQTSFIPDPLPRALERMLPNQYVQAGQARQIDSQQIFAELVRQLLATRCPIEVLGFASSEGSLSLNNSLADARRDAVAEQLIELGIHPARLSLGTGAVLDSFDVLAENRRVEIRLKPDLAWHCRELEAPQVIFPTYGIWRFQGEGAERPQQSSGSGLARLLAPQLAKYPCQTAIHIWAGPEQYAQAREALATALGVTKDTLPPHRFYASQSEEITVYLGIPQKGVHSGAFGR